MICRSKLLIDSGLAVRFVFDSNKTAPKRMKNAPILGRGKVKIKITNNIRHHDVATKVGIIFDTTKKPPRSSLTVAGNPINLKN